MNQDWISQHSSDDREPSTADMIDRLSRFDGPPEQFLINLLAVQCHLAKAEGGAILRAGPEGGAEVIAVYPLPEEGSTAPVWLAQSAEAASEHISRGKTTILPLHGQDALYGQPARRYLVMVPFRSGGDVRGLAAFAVNASDDKVLAAIRERLELTISLLSLYEMRLTLQRRQVDMRRLRMAMETLTTVNEHDRFTGAAMALCNEVAARWNCERVGLGFLKGRYVHLRAMSHTEKFSRKMQLVQDTESVMEECIDQDVEVLHPPEAEATYVSRAAGELSKRHGPMNVLSLPLRKDGEAVAILTVERPTDNPFNLEDVESLRLTCELCTTRLVDLHEHDRWIGARAAAGARKGLATVLGPKHTWIKVAAILILGAVLFTVFAKGEYRVDAPFVLEATQRQVIPAPFDGYLKSVGAFPGDEISGGHTVLATLDTAELRLQLAAARAEREGYLKQVAAAVSEGKTAEAQIAQAEVEKVDAQIKLLQHRIAQAEIYSPISGCIVKGDLKRQIGAPVKTGDVLFEVAPLESLRAELLVPEDEIADVKVGQEGELATASYPGRRIKFVVERINPVAEVVSQRNVFKVRVRLLETKPWMRPGMEGVAKVSVDRRSYAWLWTHKLVNWIRMKLWL